MDTMKFPRRRQRQEVIRVRMLKTPVGQSADISNIIFTQPTHSQATVCPSRMVLELVVNDLARSKKRSTLPHHKDWNV